MHFRVHCLQLGGADLTSAAGKMIMGMLNTFAGLAAKPIELEAGHGFVGRARLLRRLNGVI
jgi:hypothetical protein